MLLSRWVRCEVSHMSDKPALRKHNPLPSVTVDWAIVAPASQSFTMGYKGTRMSDAERVARHAIRNAMTVTSDKTGLRAGPAVDRLVDQILVELLSPNVRWAILALAAEAGATSPTVASS